MMMNFLRGNAPAQPSQPQMSLQDIVAKAANGEVTVIDVRDHNELAMTGKARGALHIPLSIIRMQADPSSPDFHPELKTDKPVGIYCASGARSSMAVRLLQSLGYSEVYNIGGLGHWQMAGGEIERA